MKDNFDIYAWNKKRRQSLHKSLINEQVEMPNIPDTVFNKYAQMIKNPPTMASAILGFINKVAEKENDSLLKNMSIKRVIDILGRLSKEKAKPEEANEAMMIDPDLDNKKMGKEDPEFHNLKNEEELNETLDPYCHDLADKICNYLGDKECVDALIRAMSTEDCKFYLEAIARDYDIPTELDEKKHKED